MAAVAAKALLETYVGAMNRGALADCLACLDDCVSVTFPEAHRNWSSRDTAATKFGGMFKSLPSFTVSRYDTLTCVESPGATLAASRSDQPAETGDVSGSTSGSMTVYICLDCDFRCEQSGYSNLGQQMGYTILCSCRSGAAEAAENSSSQYQCLIVKIDHLPKEE